MAGCVPVPAVVPFFSLLPFSFFFFFFLLSFPLSSLLIGRIIISRFHGMGFNLCLSLCCDRKKVPATGGTIGTNDHFPWVKIGMILFLDQFNLLPPSCS
ncbi:uncharacterized protein BO80DRAFT_167494 [Aspergillus ibericus CBS 121593]|uniref:Uncharacterized protein n=1 Tax=Aspergillus ibericus CBS 121593 TaxID=1448316 RepID=A0A395GTJ3_9EURO|nr:hypothetical protein BO80DRAFT_167494 [Aspergillus ibericus CBS 121593]RAK97997.1 hypothetical protein BO80DRAFT_167494 [Aspergillus ibericus CBS 121593]